MIAKLIPVIFLVAGTAAGVGAGKLLAPGAKAAAPAVDMPDDDQAATAEKAAESAQDAPEDAASVEYVRMDNQFVVPLVSNERIAGLVVMSLSLEVPAGSSDAFYSREPKLRDAFLGVLFDHANLGGFDGAFTSSNNMDVLRMALKETAASTLGQTVYDVLILDIARQDI
jgi:flagellar FliL protein